ncbi:MAG: HEAT repeat domain-containing protein [Deltaproteobacteria bacterium]|nr:HEAT repeat domain-containing protein [Deltaproteobacteria bacterium]
MAPAFAGALYLLLVASAALGLWVSQVPEAVPPALAAAVPWTFLLFVTAFAVYRMALVRARRYPASKALFQIGTAVLFFMLLLPRAKVGGGEDELTPLLRHGDPSVRAVAAEVARCRPDGQRHARLLVEQLRDPDPRVQAAAHASQVALAGADLGPPGNDEALRRWKERYP